MQTLTLTLPKLHPAQAQVKRGARRFSVLNCGRRFGKSLLGIDMVTEPLLAGFPVAFYSPTYKMLGEIWRECRHRFAPVAKSKNETEHRIETITGGVLEMWSLEDPESSRGRKYKRVIIDEAAKVKKLEEAWTQVIRPTLADYQGDALFLSTPKGLNYFYTLWQNPDRDAQNWARFHFPTNANPFIKSAEIEAMRLELPERVYRQEILAEFIADGSFFQNIDRCAVLDQPDDPAQHGDHYIVCGVDWALSEDYTVFTLACRDCNRVVDWFRSNRLDFTYQREALRNICNLWNVSALLPERNSIGEPNIEILVQMGLPVITGPGDVLGFNTSATTKPELIMGLASALEHHGFLVPRDYADELRSYEVETMASGHPKFSAPDGQHDDRVISLALSWYAMSHIPWLIS